MNSFGQLRVLPHTTAIALFVDGARLPIYLANQHTEMTTSWRSILVATVA